jgi:metal-responsive CopG/Arc/MetJ family transcriptional regulator
MVNDQMITMKLPKALAKKALETGRKLGVSRSAFIRMAILEKMEKLEKKREVKKNG